MSLASSWRAASTGVTPGVVSGLLSACFTGFAGSRRCFSGLADFRFSFFPNEGFGAFKGSVSCLEISAF
ncbi:MAG: hypothetical protein DMG09_01935 [Acidobacteria bacterium]|nr:MAG: hypothetical protein DMG09_01935 [Acidobacteriota bacterium]